MFYPHHIVITRNGSNGTFTGDFTRYNKTPTMSTEDIKEFYAWHRGQYPGDSVVITNIVALTPVEEIPPVGPNKPYTPADTRPDYFKMLRQLMGYVENASDCTIRLFQDDATMTFWVKAVSMDKELWSEHGNSLEQAIRLAHEKHYDEEA